jgi:hypothetical protein
MGTKLCVWHLGGNSNEVGFCVAAVATPRLNDPVPVLVKGTTQGNCRRRHLAEALSLLAHQ